MASCELIHPNVWYHWPRSKQANLCDISLASFWSGSPAKQVTGELFYDAPDNEWIGNLLHTHVLRLPTRNRQPACQRRSCVTTRCLNGTLRITPKTGIDLTFRFKQLWKVQMSGREEQVRQSTVMCSLSRIVEPLFVSRFLSRNKF